MKHNLLILYAEIRNALHIIKVLNAQAFLHRREAYRIILLTHTIEKGLSLQSPRPGFGVKKIYELLALIKKDINIKDEIVSQAIYMGMGAINAYLEYHRNIDFSNDDILSIKDQFSKLLSNFPKSVSAYGGVINLKREEICDGAAVETLERIMKTRHSIRDFSEEDIPNAVIYRAISMAQFAPSACNRQPTRIYIVEGREKEILYQYLQGIGGFYDKVCKYLIITSDICAYSKDEINQWIVNAGIFSGYLVLSLHSLGVASCIIQRDLLRSKRIKQISTSMNIPENEQIIMMIGIGGYKNEFVVPVSHRFSYDMLVNERTQ